MDPLPLERGLHVAILVKESSVGERKGHRQMAAAFDEFSAAHQLRRSSPLIVEELQAVRCQSCPEHPAKKHNHSDDYQSEQHVVSLGLMCVYRWPAITTTTKSNLKLSA